MNYEFPTIYSIEQAIAAVDGADEFVIAEKDGYTIFNYNVVMPDTFPEVETLGDAIRRECRGLVFDSNGEVLSRRLHKFFNVGEKDETQLSALSLFEPHVILEKLDGSMITPLILDGDVYWATKMGHETDVAKSASKFVDSVKDTMDYNGLAVLACYHKITPIFEYCSPKHRIVVDYPEEKMVLIAVRDNMNGSYWSYDGIVSWAKLFNVPVVREYPGTPEDMTKLVEMTKGQEEGEGWIVRFGDGHMVKIKSEHYLRIHRTKSDLQYERNLVSLIINNELDDLKGMLPTEDVDKIVEFEREFWGKYFDVLRYLNDVYSYYHQQSNSRAEFADLVLQNRNPLFRGILFGMHDGKNSNDLLLDTIKKYLTKNVKYENMKAQLLPNLKDWRY